MYRTDLIAWTLWNTFLAFVPVAVAQIIRRMESRSQKRPLMGIPMVVLTLVWLAFLPNACYLLTEWRHYLAMLDTNNLYLAAHLSSAATLRLMIYTVFFFCYSAIGMIAFALAIRPMARLVKDHGGAVWVWAALLFILVSVGVYLGLVLRFNSWELLTRPQSIWSAVMSLLSRPLLAAFIVAFAGFLWLAYFVIDVWIDGFQARWEAVSSHRKS